MNRTGFSLLAGGSLLAALLAVSPANAQTYERTVIVSPVPGNPVASGAAVIAALAGIRGANADNRWLIKIEPGVYDLQSFPLLMQEWVDIEGSGNTELRGEGRNSIAGGTVVGANDAELRELTVVTDGLGTRNAAVGIYLNNVNTRVSRVRVVTSGAIDAADGFYVVGGAPRLSEIEVLAQGASFATGIVVEGSSSATIAKATIEVKGAKDTNRGVLIQEAVQTSEPALFDVHIEAGGGRFAYGIVGRDKFTALPIVLQSCSVRVGSASVENVGLFFPTSGGNVRLVSSLIDATGTGSYGVWAKTAGVSLTIGNSEVSGEVSSVTAAPGEGVRAHHSVLGGGPASEMVLCAGVSDENAVFYPDTCP